mmetsp:Transcript_17826/g.49860  ORF Transcript_17826/g.49860 Transcript_17826/m.49860 type:complete len:215 (-) Transcript_17826:3584-4228(-)
MFSVHMLLYLSSSTLMGLGCRSSSSLSLSVALSISAGTPSPSEWNHSHATAASLDSSCASAGLMPPSSPAFPSTTSSITSTMACHTMAMMSGKYSGIKLSFMIAISALNRFSMNTSRLIFFSMEAASCGVNCLGLLLQRSHGANFSVVTPATRASRVLDRTRSASSSLTISHRSLSLKACFTELLQFCVTLARTRLLAEQYFWRVLYRWFIMAA